MENMLELGLKCDIFGRQIHAYELNEATSVVTFRTNDIVPFTGDFELVEVQCSQDEADAFRGLNGKGYEEGEWLKEMSDDSTRTDVTNRACKALSRTLTQYIESIVTQKIRELNNGKQFSNIYAGTIGELRENPVLVG